MWRFMSRTWRRVPSFIVRFCNCSLLPRPDFDFPGAWFRLGDYQELHLIGGRGQPVFAHHRGNHFALRTGSLTDWERHFRQSDSNISPANNVPMARGRFSSPTPTATSSNCALCRSEARHGIGGTRLAAKSGAAFSGATGSSQRSPPIRSARSDAGGVVWRDGFHHRGACGSLASLLYARRFSPKISAWSRLKPARCSSNSHRMSWRFCGRPRWKKSFPRTRRFSRKEMTATECTW